MRITFDPDKREATLTGRGLDFAEAVEVFAAELATAEDRRSDYGEDRFVTAGFLRGRMVVVVWTPRGDARHVISMRYAHAREHRRWQDRVGRSG